MEAVSQNVFAVRVPVVPLALAKSRHSILNHHVHLRHFGGFGVQIQST